MWSVWESPICGRGPFCERGWSVYWFHRSRGRVRLNIGYWSVQESPKMASHTASLAQIGLSHRSRSCLLISQIGWEVQERPWNPRASVADFTATLASLAREVWYDQRCTDWTLWHLGLSDRSASQGQIKLSGTSDSLTDLSDYWLRQITWVSGRVRVRESLKFVERPWILVSDWIRQICQRVRGARESDFQWKWSNF